MSSTPSPPPSDIADEPTPPAYGQPAYGAAGAQPGELLDRFLARLIDGVLLAVVNGVIISGQAWHDRFTGGTRVVEEG